ncbi:ABC transporter ATP-binding protein/permease [Shewanella xiamenensis]|uniref:ABC transporter ATP-binding protein/permease n=1 Tax=Shewanella TaxID=22 RepID=UPI001C4E1C65|nr:ABC transporter ATP-binding protein/permease [Shewanella xiamenensis]MCT8872091.1 ABC transporter ATP-binding protein/permease [Shewanella xiamenensis]MDH1313044.1 ABC transporter ATP-binding protein/permease [Shewanella xiamenensis]MDI5877349.1 ABC transporter ATP-binding protein/permease [Shewanella xiamenensis]UWH41258.1 ABC transporter ATP-binding protein/permease [Shewanella xiamenensis]
MSQQSSHTSVRQRAVLPWIWQFLKPYRLRVVAAIVFLLIGSLAWLSLGQGVRLMVDEGFIKDNAQRLNEIILLVLLITAVSGTAVFCRFYLMTWLGERVSADIRLAVYNQLLKLSPAFYAKVRTGEVISRFTADSTLLQTVVGSSLSMALRSGVTVIGGLAMMGITSVKMTLLVLLAVPLVLGPVGFFGRKVRTLARESQDRVADLGAYVDETLHEIHTVQAYGHEDKDRSLFNGRVEDVMTAASGRIRYRALLISSVMFLSIAAIALVTWVGAHDVMSGKMTGGELSAFMFYAVMVAGAVATISEVVGEIQRASGAAERLIELAETEVDIPAPLVPKTLPDKVRGELQLQQLNFHYPEQTQLVLSDLDLVINAGERVALVGPSGAGKSTLFQLLQRFYVPSSGSILLDGIDIAALSPQDLRAQFALVPQDSVIFATSVLENVRYGRVDASEQEVIDACIAARAHEFISEFNEGYQTYLGERGVRLSGGQKQRIAIARAILADRPILLLDEATSALDALSEQKVKLALDELMAGKTTLIIAHRLATVINADRIIVFDKGRIVASGKHQTLMQTNDLYREFASLQLLTDEVNPLSE